MAKRMKNVKIRESKMDVVLDVITSIILILFTVIVLYPLIYVISCSISSSNALSGGRVVFWPVDATLQAYKFVMAYKDVWVGFRNSLFYCVVDCLFQMSCTIMMAYALSRSYCQGRKFYTWYFFMTTRFSAGLTPIFILKCSLGLYNNVWAILIGGVIAVGHVLILRTAINTTIPSDLHDAAMMDGANHFQIVFKLVMPLCKATLSVLCLYCLVGQWNEYFNAMIFLQDKQYFPLQLVLRPIMTAASMVNQMDTGSMSVAYQQQANEGLENVRYALIIISSVPVIVLYFFVQKYFKGGMMMGSVKG